MADGSRAVTGRDPPGTLVEASVASLRVGVEAAERVEASPRTRSRCPSPSGPPGQRRDQVPGGDLSLLPAHQGS